MKGVENHGELGHNFLQVLEHYGWVCLHFWPIIPLTRAQLHFIIVQIICTSWLALFYRLEIDTGFWKDLF